MKESKSSALETRLGNDFLTELRAEPALTAWQQRRHLINACDLSLDELSLQLALVGLYKKHKAHLAAPLAVLNDKTIATLFYENSTRTKSSFDLAARKLGATVLHLDVKTSSVAKGETLLDTALNLSAMGVNAVVMRHSQAGAPDQLAQALDQTLPKVKDPARSKAMSVLNAGDGNKSHPSQGLLDLYTILEKLDRLPVFAASSIDKSIKGKLNSETLSDIKIAIVGDILHSRVARSDFQLLSKLGCSVHFAGPETLLPKSLEAELGGSHHHNLKDALSGADFIVALRIQLERQEQGLIKIDDYVKEFQLDHQKLKLCKPEVKLLHPGPVNRGIEITEDLADDQDLSLILSQVTNGVLTRMAALTLLLGSESP
jgi:aspartate carbamoyltransferase catalytic subunit